MEKDLATSDYLGSTEPILFSDLAEWEGRIKHNVSIYDKYQKDVGEITFETVFIWEHYEQPQNCHQLDKKSKLKIIVEKATFLKDSDMFGKQDPYM